MRQSVLPVILLTLLLGFSPLAKAQWTPTNGPGHGTVRSFAVSGGNLFAATSSGVLVSTNKGANWMQTGLTNDAVVALAVCMNGAGDTTLFAGTSSKYGGEGVFRSTDNGGTWTSIDSGLIGRNVRALAVASDTAGGSCLFAGLGPGYKFPPTGVFLSTNNGTSWVPVNSGLADTNILTLAICPNSAGGTYLFAGTFHGVFLSTNNGTSWRAVNTGMATTVVTTLAVSPNGTGGTNVLAGSDNGIFLSTDYGSNWTAVDAGLADTHVNTLAVMADGAGGAHLFAGTSGGSMFGGGVYRSTNNGASWAPANAGIESRDVFALAVSPSSGGSGLPDLYAGPGGGGVFHTTNEGTHWFAADNGMSSNTTIFSLAANGTNLMAGTDDGLFLSTNNGSDWVVVNTGLPRTYIGALGTGPNRTGGTNFFAATGFGVFASRDTGKTWVPANNGLTSTYVRSFAVTSNGIGGTYLFAGTSDGGVFYSPNNGENWTAVNTDLTNADVVALAVSGDNLFAGTSGGGVFLYSNSGSHWLPVNTGLTSNFVSALVATPTGTGDTNLYVSASDGVSRSTDNGAHWTAVNAGLPDVGILAASGTNVFAGANFGADSSRVFLSTDNGERWNQVNSGLGSTNVSALVAGDTHLFLASPTGGVWRRPLSDMIATAVDERSGGGLPVSFELKQNFPNPFNPSTTIEFSIPRAAHVVLNVFNTLGQKITTLVSEERGPGTYTTRWDAAGVASGVYFYRLEAGNYTETKKIILLR